MTAIVDLDLLHKPVLHELLTDTVLFLVHPVGNCNFYRMTLYWRSTCCCRVYIHLSVTSRHCTKRAKCRITQTRPYDSPGTPVFWRQRSRRNSNGVTPTGVPNRGG